MGIRSEVYLSYIVANTALVGASMLVFAALVNLVLLPLMGIGVPGLVVGLIWVSPVLLAQMTFAALYLTPSSKAKNRAKDIDLRLPYALNYISAMASAGIIPAEIFRSLARQRIYGEVATEAMGIYRDIEYHGKDIVTALRHAIQRSPSVKFQELMQGAITTITSGGDLQLYFSAKAQRHMWENRQDQKNFLEIMGLMAETYVTAAVAGPLFLIVMMSIMTMLSGGGPTTLALVVYLLLPIINGGFVFGIMNMIPEV